MRSHQGLRGDPYGFRTSVALRRRLQNVITSADQPAAMVHPEMPVEVRRAALPRVRAAPDDDRPADAALGAQRIVSAEVEVRPDSAWVRHGAQTARVGAHPMRDARVPAGRRGRRGGGRRQRRRRQQRRGRRRRRRRRRGRHARLAEVAVLLVLRLLLHRPQAPPDVRRGGRRDDRYAPRCRRRRRRRAATTARKSDDRSPEPFLAASLPSPPVTRFYSLRMIQLASGRALSGPTVITRARLCAGNSLSPKRR